MSKMTSSSSCIKHSTTTQSSPKMLTDFSIQTIIGSEKPTTTTKITTPEASQLNGRSSLSSRRKFRPKNFQCPACKMAFSNNGQLKNHVRIHTGERPFTCPEPDCNKSFTRNEELTRHKLIHTGVRPHACTSCGKRFGRKDHLKKHARTHDKRKLRKKLFVGRQTNTLIEHHHHQQSESKVAVCTSSQTQPSASSICTGQTCILNGPSSDTAAAIQQLATDYWSKWYNYYHNLYQSSQLHFFGKQ